MTEVNLAFINTSYTAFFFSGWQKRAEEAESKGELGKDRSTYFDRIVKEGEKAGE